MFKALMKKVIFPTKPPAVVNKFFEGRNTNRTQGVMLCIVQELKRNKKKKEKNRTEQNREKLGIFCLLILNKFLSITKRKHLS